jgi:sugar phosphate permease
MIQIAVILLLLSLVSSSLAFPHAPTVTTTQHRRPNVPARHQSQTKQKDVFVLRGGAARSHRPEDAPTSSTDHHQHEEQQQQRRRRRQRRGMSWALASSYFAVMGAKCALPSVLSLVTSRHVGMTFSSSSSPQHQMARLLGLSTLAVATGKLLLGPVIDAMGGIQSLRLALGCLAVSLGIISCLQSFSYFGVIWMSVDFIFSACWAACINAIHQSFDEEEWGRQVGYLATGARTGNAVAFSLFATVLWVLERRPVVKQPWRVVFLASAILQLMPFGLLSYFGRETLMQQQVDPPVDIEKQQSTNNSFKILLHEARTAPEFWLHLLSRSCLMIFASFLLFVPTLMSQVYAFSNAAASQIASIYSLGCLLSVSVGSQIYSKLPRQKQVLSIIVLMGLATICSLIQLGHVSGVLPISAGMAAFSMFIWGFAFSIPFYLPPSLYALERGGRKGSATISDGFDFFGFALLAVFNNYVAGISHSNPTAWIGCFRITTICSLISLFAQSFAVFLQ